MCHISDNKHDSHFVARAPLLVASTHTHTTNQKKTITLITPQTIVLTLARVFSIWHRKGVTSAPFQQKKTNRSIALLILLLMQKTNTDNNIFNHRHDRWKCICCRLRVVVEHI